MMSELTNPTCHCEKTLRPQAVIARRRKPMKQSNNVWIAATTMWSRNDVYFYNSSLRGAAKSGDAAIQEKVNRNGLLRRSGDLLAMTVGLVINIIKAKKKNLYEKL